MWRRAGGALAAMKLAVAACSSGVAGHGSAPARASVLASRPASAPPRSLSPTGSGSPLAVVPALDPLQLAELLVRAAGVRGMELDINPNWPVFVTYDPPAATSAAPANGSKLLASMTQGPATFFEATWARDFITMSARPAS
jgi:hypothetical protein